MTKTVIVKHPNNYKEFAFKTDLDLQKDDLVVCDTVVGYALGTVVAVDQELPATKWIVAKVDLSAHLERAETEQKIKELRNKMVTRRKVIEEKEIYKMLAEKDIEMASMIEEFEKLTGSKF